MADSPEQFGVDCSFNESVAGWSFLIIVSTFNIEYFLASWRLVREKSVFLNRSEIIGASMISPSKKTRL